MQDAQRTQRWRAPLAVLHVDFPPTAAKLIFSMHVFQEDALQNSVQVAAPSNNEIYGKPLTARFEVSSKSCEVPTRRRLGNRQGTLKVGQHHGEPHHLPAVQSTA